MNPQGLVVPLDEAALFFVRAFLFLDHEENTHRQNDGRDQLKSEVGGFRKANDSQKNGEDGA